MSTPLPPGTAYLGDRTSGANWPGWPPTHTGWTPSTEMTGPGGTRIVILNPMHIVNLSDETHSKLVKFVEYFRSFTEKWFSHILLLLFLFLYGCLGAWIFMMVEGRVEMRSKAPVVNMKDRIKNELWYFTHTHKIPRQHLNRVIEVRLQEFELQLYENFKSGVATDSSDTVWTFWASFVYCFTVFTTIGYGHIAPITTLGRAISMAYACIGIPLLLMVLADLGKLFTRAIKYVFKYIRKGLHSRRVRQVRDVGRRATLVPQQIGAFNKKRKLAKDEIDVENAVNEDLANDTGQTEVQMQLPPTTPYFSPGAPMFHGGTMMSPPIIVTGCPTPPSGSRPGTPGAEMDGKPSGYQVDDDFNLPVSIALLILILYMTLGALIFTYTDGWTFFDSFYFVYISMSTIGFGDMTPESDLSMIAASIYLLFGLALTSMCINVIQEKLAASFDQAKLRIGMKMGLDIQKQIEAQRQQEEEAAKGEKDKSEKPDKKKKKDKDKSKDKKDKKSDKIALPKEILKKDPKVVSNGKANEMTIAKEPAKNVGFALANEDIGKRLKERRDNKRATPSPVAGSSSGKSDSSDDGKKSPSDEPGEPEVPREPNVEKEETESNDAKLDNDDDEALSIEEDLDSSLEESDIPAMDDDEEEEEKAEKKDTKDKDVKKSVPSTNL